MEDYFTALDLPRDAPVVAIDARIKQEIRTWQKRTTNPDLGRRQEAERRLRLLAEARDVLLDDERRAAHLAGLPDPGVPPRQQPATPPLAAPRTPAGSPAGDWLTQARAYLDQGDHASALYAAREARNADGRSAEAWNLLARANMGMGNHRDALGDARRAADLEPRNPEYYFDQGRVHEELGQLDDALRCYEVATKLDPGADEPRLAMAGVVAQGDRPERALPALEDLYERAGDNVGVGLVLAGCLARTAEHVPRERTQEGFRITSAEEVDAMERLLFRARQVTADPEVLHYVAGLEGQVRWAKDRHIRTLDRAGGCGLAVAGAAALVAVIVGFWFLSSPSAVKAVVLLLSLGAVAGYVWWAWLPGWKLNKTQRRQP
ncbi:MAG: tetratricopeptide repeat protein [Streptosporangiales bacterium]|nr:tetratricopeptide repeat protein [Streptosporangiales bacterium]